MTATWPLLSVTSTSPSRVVPDRSRLAALASGAGLVFELPPVSAAELMLPLIATLKWTLFRFCSEVVVLARMSLQRL